MTNTSTVKTNSNIIPMTSATVNQLHKAGFTRSQIVKMKHLSPHVPTQPIKSLEDIKKVKEYFLSRPKSYRTLNTNIRNYAIFTFGINTNYRGSDLLNFKIKDVLNPNLTFKDEYTTIESKTGKTKLFYLCDNVKESIKMYLNTRPNFSLNDYLFVSKKSHIDEDTGKLTNQLTLRGLNHALEKMSKEVNLSAHHKSSHMMRKTWAYQKYEAHKDNPYVLNTIQDALNHSSEKTTLKYIGIDNEVKRDLYLNDQL